MEGVFCSHWIALITGSVRSENEQHHETAYLLITQLKKKGSMGNRVEEYTGLGNTSYAFPLVGLTWVPGIDANIFQNK